MMRNITGILIVVLGLLSGASVAAPVFQAAGTAVNGTGNVSPAWPAHLAGDVALLFVESTGGEPVTLSTPAGFVQVANSPQATGATTNGTQLTVFWARATSAAMATPTVFDPGNHVYARILTYRGVIASGNPWDVTGGGIKATASASLAVTGVTTTVDETLVVQAASHDRDNAGAHFSAQTNANLTGLTERADAGTTSGNGGGIAVWDGVMATAGATGDTAVTLSNNVVNAFLTIALRAPPPALPTATTNAATAVADTTATLNGVVTSNNAVTTIQFEYGLTTTYTGTAIAAQSPLAAGTTPTAMSALVISLACETTYHYRVVATNSVGTANGSDQTFTTAACAATPAVTTNAATGVGAAGATLNGAATSNGGSTAVTFEYGLTASYGSVITATTSPLPPGAVNTAFSAALTGLPCGTTYHFRAKAENSAGSATGIDRTFTTSACALPTVATVAATSITTTSATLNGTVNDNGSITTVTFDYGPTTGYGSTAVASMSPVGPGWGSVSESATASGLACNTLYHYRIRGVNPAGASNGADMSFTTAACPTSASSATANPTNCVDDIGIGTVAWGNPTRAFTSDNNYASATVDGATTHFLKCTGYGFAIPAAATITGILVNVERKSNSTANGGSQDAAMRLVAADVIQSIDRSMPTIYTTNDVVEAHGGATDLWGGAWAPADINLATFGAAFAATKASTAGTGHQITVDHMPITVYYAVPPSVASINRTSPDPTSANTSVSWDVLFNTSVTGVDADDFTLVQAGGVTGATITSVTGTGAVRTVTANTGTGTVGTLALRLVDNDSIINGASVPLGGSGAGNGTFTGQAYTLIVKVCTSGLLFCDDFERSVFVGGSNTANAVGVAPGYGAWVVSPLGAACAGVAGNAGCAGIDSDIPPFDVLANPRANATRAMFTRWANVIVTSPVIDLSTKTGAQLSFWLRRGSDCFSEWPGDNLAGCGAVFTGATAKVGEEFQIQYKNNAGAWIVLVQYPMEDVPGQIMTPVIGLPDDALHAGFQFRFVQPGGSGSGFTNIGAPGVRGADYWHVDDVKLEEVPRVTNPGPFCDTFESDLSRWDVAGTGNIRIGSTYFETGAHNMDLRWNTVSATTKGTNLLNNSGNNTISYWVMRGNGNNTTYPNTFNTDWPETVAKGLRFEYLNAAGTWLQLPPPSSSYFPGGGTAGEIFPPVAIPMPADAKHSNFKLRISMLSGSGVYDQDYWHVDNVCIGTTVGATDLSLSMTSAGTFSPGQYVTYTMTVTNNGPNDDPGPIAIVDTLPTGLSYASGSAGWSCVQAGQEVTCTQTGGLAAGATTTLILTATVDATATGSVTNTATVGGQTSDAALANNTATRTDTIFVPGYVYTDSACAMDGTAIGTGAQCNAVTWSPQSAGTPQGSVYITAVNSSNVPIQLHATNPTTVNMQFALSCRNPTLDAGVQATFSAAVTGGNPTGTLPLCMTNGDTPTTWTTAKGFVFPAATASIGPYSFNYDDVGEVELFVRNSAVTSQMGRSGGFVVRPDHFDVTSIRCTTADATNCGAGALAMPTAGDNPAAADATGVSFIPAGKPFTVTVVARNAAGNTTPNYGRETPTPQVVTLQTVSNALACPAASSCLVAPAGGAAGALSGTFATTSQQVLGVWISHTGTVETTDAAWSEVGIVRLRVANDYLGAGAVYGLSGNVGRFYPDHFDTIVTAPMGCAPGQFSYTTPCPGDGLAYSGQAFTVDVYARNAAFGTTSNYAYSATAASNFARAVTLSAVDDAGGVVSGAGSLTAGAGMADALFASGHAALATTAYSFNTVPTEPTDVYIRAANAETSSLRAIVTDSEEGGLKVVSGRLKLTNAYGSERLQLTLQAAAQYFTANGWVNSITDSVTGLTLAGSYNVVRNGATTGTTTPAPTGATTLNAGVRNIVLSPPGAGVTGTATVSPTGVPAWLPLTSGTATFGVYRNNSNYIYRREN